MNMLVMDPQPGLPQPTGSRQPPRLWQAGLGALAVPSPSPGPWYLLPPGPTARATSPSLCRQQGRNELGLVLGIYRGAAAGQGRGWGGSPGAAGAAFPRIPALPLIRSEAMPELAAPEPGPPALSLQLVPMGSHDCCLPARPRCGVIGMDVPSRPLRASWSWHRDSPQARLGWVLAPRS